MVSFIIVAKEKTRRETYIKNYAAKQAIDMFDITVLEKDQANKTAQSIGIEQIKLLRKRIFLKPIKSTDKLVIIEDAQLLTLEAQNALLKILEEPPAHTLIFLGTETQESLLPTILSRCQIIELQTENKNLSEQTLAELHTFIEALPGLSVGEKLKYAERLAKDKDKATEWIVNLILILREQLINSYLKNSNKNASDTFDSSYTLRKLQTLHILLKTTNVNPRFAIGHTLLSI
jgi:DNA polymerase III delta prime subunit